MLNLELPTIKDKGSFFLSFRSFSLNRILRQRAPTLSIGFGDLSFKINQKLNNNNRLYFTFHVNSDQLLDTSGNNELGNVGLRWGNFVSTLRWNHLYGPRLFSNLTLYTGTYGYRLFGGSNFWKTGLATLSLKNDFTFYQSDKSTSKFGFELQGYFIDPGSAALDASIGVLPEINSNLTAKSLLYYQNEFRLNKKMKLNAGLRLVNWRINGPATYYNFDDNYEVSDTLFAEARESYASYTKLDPRITLNYSLSENEWIVFGVGRYHQFLQQISNSDSPFNALEVWFPAGPNLRPQASNQISIDYTRLMKNNAWEFNSALYYKSYNNQIDYVPHADLLVNPLLEGELRIGRMNSYGLESTLQKKFGKLKGKVSYTFSRSIRKTPGLNQGKSYRAFQDRPHGLIINLNYDVSKRFQMSAFWISMSGSTFSSPTGFYQFQGIQTPIYNSKNNDRLPAYHRLDLALNYRFNKDFKKKYQHSIKFSIYNVLARDNAFRINFNKLEEVGSENPLVITNLFDQQLISPSQMDLFRFFPSLSYKFSL